MAVRRSQVPPHLYARYGISERRSPWQTLALALLAVTFIGSLAAIARGLGPGEEVKLISWQPTSAGAEVKWTVVRYDDSPVYCVLRAQDEDRFDIAFAVVKVRRTAAQPVFANTLELRGDLYTVDTPACSTEPSKLIRPHFRPGVLPPAQVSPLFAPWQPVTAWLGG